MKKQELIDIRKNLEATLAGVEEQIAELNNKPGEWDSEDVAKCLELGRKKSGLKTQIFKVINTYNYYNGNV